MHKSEFFVKTLSSLTVDVKTCSFKHALSTQLHTKQCLKVSSTNYDRSEMSGFLKNVNIIEFYYYCFGITMENTFKYVWYWFSNFVK